MSRFTGRQVTTIIVSVCAAVVLTPSIVYAAATSTSVRIVDPSHPARKAHVDAHGHLVIGDGKGPLTVNGTVSARSITPAHPWNPVNFVTVSSGATRATLYSAQVPTKLNITSFTVAAENGGGGTVEVAIQVYVSQSASGDCVTLGGGTFGAAERFLVTVPEGQTVTLPFPTPLQYTAYGSNGDKYCVDAEGSGPSGYSAFVFASGFIS